MKRRKGYLMKYKMDKEYIKCLADDYGYKQADPQPDKYYIRFLRGKNEMLDWWFTTNTVRKIKNGKPSYSRDNTIETMQELFK